MARPKSARGLASHLRRRIVELLREAGPLTQSQLAGALGLSWGALQWHLYVLEREGLVKKVYDGYKPLYYVTSSL